MAHDNADREQPDDPLLIDHPTPSQACIAGLPAETLYHILRFLPPQDLIRLQAVSKTYHAIIRDPTFWRTRYASARLPLPPGPFLWQSSHFLQRTLVHSTRLAHTWTTEPLTLLSSKIYTGPRSIDKDRFRWVHGRWLIVSKDMRQLRTRDVETGAERVLWDHAPFSGWAAASLMVPEGHFMYVAVHLGKGRPDDEVRLLEFMVDDDTGQLSGPEILEVPFLALHREEFIPQIRVYTGIAAYVYISLCSTKNPKYSLVFDPRRRRFYKFPRFRTQLDLLVHYRGQWHPHLVEVYFTQTHLLVLSHAYLIHGHLGEVEVIQTFTLPDDDPEPTPGPSGTSGPDDTATTNPIVRELRLTHEMLHREVPSMWLAAIRAAIVDPITQTTTLRFMHTYAPIYRSPGMRVRLVCTDYILAAPTAASASSYHHNTNDENPNLYAIVRSKAPVLPITAVSHDVLSVSVPGMWKKNLIDVSHDGFVRGLCMVDANPEDLTDTSWTIYRFTVDATGEQCVGVVGDPCPPWVELDPARHYEYALDGMRGKIWYTKGDVLEYNTSGEPVDRDVLAIVLDFK